MYHQLGRLVAILVSKSAQMCVSVQQKLLLNCCLSLYLDRKRGPLITKLENIIAHHRPSPMLVRIILCCRLACNNDKIK